jgi:hypothetical protein
MAARTCDVWTTLMGLSAGLWSVVSVMTSRKYAVFDKHLENIIPLVNQYH